jgi:uncharacterized protein
MPKNNFILKSGFTIFLLTCLSWIAVSITSCSSNPNELKIKKSLSGRWEGLLQYTNKSFRLAAGISVDSDKNLVVKLSSPGQRIFLMPVDSLNLLNNKISFKVSKFKASYEGEFKIDSSEIVGTWNQGKFNIPLIFYREGELGRTNRPQYPFRPYPYNSDSVTFKNENSDITLAGTLTYPKSQGPFPAVLLINGMGPQDRDESMYGHKPFLIISDYLTRHGFAVLRVDDRGTGLSSGNFDSSTTKDFASDALAAVNFLKSNKNVDSTKMGLVGFNEGGLIAALLAAKSNDIKFITLLATPGVPGKEILLDQTLYLQKNMGVPEKEIQQDYRFNNIILNIILSEKDTAKVKQELKKAYKRFISSLGKKYAFSQKYSTRNIKNQIEFMTKPWFRYYLTYKPDTIFRKVHCPVLILYGENDLQVEPEKNNAAIEKALEEGDNHNYKSKIFPKMNHLFQETENGSPAEYSRIKETFSPKVMQLVVEWMNEIIGKRNKKIVAVK